MAGRYEEDLRAEPDEETKPGETKDQWIRPNLSPNTGGSFCSVPTGHSASEWIPLGTESLFFQSSW